MTYNVTSENRKPQIYCDDKWYCDDYIAQWIQDSFCGIREIWAIWPKVLIPPPPEAEGGDVIHIFPWNNMHNKLNIKGSQLNMSDFQRLFFTQSSLLFKKKTFKKTVCTDFF